MGIMVLRKLAFCFFRSPCLRGCQSVVDSCPLLYLSYIRLHVLWKILFTKLFCVFLYHTLNKHLDFRGKDKLGSLQILIKTNTKRAWGNSSTEEHVLSMCQTNSQCQNNPSNKINRKRATTLAKKHDYMMRYTVSQGPSFVKVANAFYYTGDKRSIWVDLPTLPNWLQQHFKTLESTRRNLPELILYALN